MRSLRIKQITMQVLDKFTIKEDIEKYLSKGKRGFDVTVPIYQIVEAILYKLKTGCQWAFIPVKQFFIDRDYSYSSVYHHYRKWSKDGSWENVWHNVLKNHKDVLDLSSIQTDGSHTPAKKGGEEVSYQGRKKCKTSNLIFLSDNAGNMLGFSDVYAGAHNDLYNISESFEKMIYPLKAAGIPIDGLFLNADAGFDADELKRLCFRHGIFLNVDENKRNGNTVEDKDVCCLFDDELYKKRFVIERANAWIDSFKTLLVRFTIKAQNWLSLHYLALVVRLLKKKFK